MTSKQLGEKIAQGNTAEVYEWRQGQILKLFYEDRSAPEVQYEANIAKAVQATGLAPRVNEVIQVGNRWGIVYERLGVFHSLRRFKTTLETCRGLPNSLLSFMSASML